MFKRRCPKVLVLGLAALALVLAAPLTALAVKAPGLASSAQYKAFIEYVTKLDGMANQPTSTEQKSTFEAKLTAKETAAAHKANALFKRSAEEAQAETDATAKEQAEGVHAREDKELEALHIETNQKLDRLEASYHIKFERIAKGHHNRETALKGQVAELRSKKSAAAPGPPKQQIQARIEKVGGEVAANRQDEKEERTQLKEATDETEAQIHAAAEAKEGEFGEAAGEKIKQIQGHWNKAYLEKKSALNKTRENRLGYLESKLEQGRADIAAMPSTG